MEKVLIHYFSSLIPGIFCLLIFYFITISGFSQNAGISAVASVPNTSAGLDVNFTNKGLLLQRVIITSTITSTPLTAYVAGMIVFNAATTSTNDEKPSR